MLLQTGCTFWKITAAPTGSSHITLTPSVQQNVMVGVEVVISCVTTQSAVIAWSSAEYIGDGLRLEYSVFNATGSISNSSKESETFANLTSVGKFILESQLHIVVSANYPRFNVTCHNPANDEVERITFIVDLAMMTETAAETVSIATSKDSKVDQSMTTVMAMVLVATLQFFKPR